MSAARALSQTAKIYAGVPERPAAQTGADPLAAIEDLVARTAQMAEQRKRKSILERAQLNSSLDALKRSEDDTSQAIQQIDETVAAISDQINAQAAFVAGVEVDAVKLLDTLRKGEPNLVAPVQEQIARFINFGKEMHDDAVDLYYFLIAQRTELEGGDEDAPSFDNPDEFRFYLKSAITAD